MSGKVLIVDDDPRSAKPSGPARAPGLSPVGAASDGNEAVSMAISLERT